MTSLLYRPMKEWNDPVTPSDQRGGTGRFRGNERGSILRRTENDLRREAEMLDATDVVVEIDLPRDAFYADGTGIKSGRRAPDFPGVVVYLVGTRFGDLRYACDQFECKWSGEPEGWEANLRAIVLGLESLRRVERYGIGRRGEQYAGWAELPPGTPLGQRAEPQPLTLDEACRLLSAGMDGIEAKDVLEDEGDARTCYRVAAKRLHPDNLHTGNVEAFKRLQEAYDLVERHHRGALV